MTFSPTEEQLAIAALAADTNESFIIDAKAGSGKTSTLGLLIEKHLKGTTILMAFNRAIADECKQKIGGRLDFARSLDVAISTVHSHGLACFRKAGSRPQTNSGKVSFLVKDILGGECDRDDDIWRNTSKISSLVGYAKAAGFGLESIHEPFPAIADERAWLHMFEHYGMEEDLQGKTTPEEICRYARIALAQSNRRLSMIDFDDMIYLPLLLNMSIPQYVNVLIDEAQDINATRRELAFRSMAPGGRIIAVGDPNQAIYGFTGADALSLQNISERIGHECRVMPLSICWRCDGKIIKEAQQIVPSIRVRPGAPDGSVQRIPFIDQTPRIGDQVEVPVKVGPVSTTMQGECVGAPPLRDLFTEAKPGDAILCRLNKPNVATCLGFLRRGKRARIEGRDIGKRLEYHATRANEMYAFQSCEETLLSLEAYEEQQLAMMVSKNKSEATMAYFQDEVDACKLVLERCIESNPSANWAAFQKLLAELFGDDVSNKDTITLASVHKSKGREWPRVFILGRSDYMPFPLAKKEWEVEQEHNLIYVAITRAERELYYVTGVRSAIDKGLHREVKPTPAPTGAEPTPKPAGLTEAPAFLTQSANAGVSQPPAPPVDPLQMWKTRNQ